MNIFRKKSHLYSAISSILILISELWLIIWALISSSSHWSFEVDAMSSSQFASFLEGVIFFSVAYVFSISFGIWQLYEEKKLEKFKVGWLSIFAPFFVFTIFVNLKKWKRSGLTKAEVNKEIKKYNINNFDDIVDIMIKNGSFPNDLKKEFKEISILKQSKLLSKYESNSHMYNLLVKRVGINMIPVTYDLSTILELGTKKYHL